MDVHAKLTDLVEKATSKQALEVDQAALKQIKLICKASDDNIRTVFELLLDKLREGSCQARCSPRHEKGIDRTVLLFKYVPSPGSPACRGAHRPPIQA